MSGASFNDRLSRYLKVQSRDNNFDSQIARCLFKLNHNGYNNILKNSFLFGQEYLKSSLIGSLLNCIKENFGALGMAILSAAK